MSQTLIKTAGRLVMACILGAPLIGCGAGSGVTEPDQYAPQPSAGDRVRLGDDDSGGARKTRKLPQR